MVGEMKGVVKCVQCETGRKTIASSHKGVVAGENTVVVYILHYTFIYIYTVVVVRLVDSVGRRCSAVLVGSCIRIIDFLPRRRIPRRRRLCRSLCTSYFPDD